MTGSRSEISIPLDPRLFNLGRWGRCPELGSLSRFFCYLDRFSLWSWSLSFNSILQVLPPKDCFTLTSASDYSWVWFMMRMTMIMMMIIVVDLSLSVCPSLSCSVYGLSFFLRTLYIVRRTQQDCFMMSDLQLCVNKSVKTSVLQVLVPHLFKPKTTPEKRTERPLGEGRHRSVLKRRHKSPLSLEIQQRGRYWGRILV